MRCGLFLGHLIIFKEEQRAAFLPLDVLGRTVPLRWGLRTSAGEDQRGREEEVAVAAAFRTRCHPQGVLPGGSLAGRTDRTKLVPRLLGRKGGLGKTRGWKWERMWQ